MSGLLAKVLETIEVEDGVGMNGQSVEVAKTVGPTKIVKTVAPIADAARVYLINTRYGETDLGHLLHAAGLPGCHSRDLLA